MLIYVWEESFATIYRLHISTTSVHWVHSSVWHANRIRCNSSATLQTATNRNSAKRTRVIYAQTRESIWLIWHVFSLAAEQPRAVLGFKCVSVVIIAWNVTREWAWSDRLDPLSRMRPRKRRKSHSNVSTEMRNGCRCELMWTPARERISHGFHRGFGIIGTSLSTLFPSRSGSRGRSSLRKWGDKTRLAGGRIESLYPGTSFRSE